MIPTLWAAATLGFRHHLAYPAEVAIQFVAACMVAGLNGALWTAAAEVSDLGGVPSLAIRTEVLVAWAGISAIATRVHEDLGERFRDGQIATDLLRPVSLPAFVYARDLGRATAAFLVQAVPLIALCAWFAPLGLPTSPLRWGLWALALLGAHAVNVAISFLLGLGAFRIGSVAGLGALKATLVSIFSGALLPLELLGPTLRGIALVLPFHVLAHTPATVLTGRTPTLALFAEQWGWAAALWGLGLLAWRRVSRTLTIQGG